MSVAAILLAAGLSTRFGSDKIAAPFRGSPLGHHAARALVPLPLIARFVVTGRTGLDWPNFEVVHNDRPEAGIAGSIVLGVAAARRIGAGAVLIALADMPLVTADHHRRLLASHRGPASRAASTDGARRMPPALFGADWFEELEQLSGDHGARALLDRGEAVLAPSAMLVDIDQPDDLAVVPR